MPERAKKTLILTALQEGELSLQGQFLQGSNYTFLARIEYTDLEFPVVYKPTRGEQPLWDFPTGTLAKREVVAFLVSETLGWDLVPPTIYRNEGPLGPGSLQEYIRHDAAYHYFNFDADDKDRLRPVMLFDFVVNNADRKGSHILIDGDNHLWLIDHGLCFHVEDKLRTVVWDFSGQNIPEGLLSDMRRLIVGLNTPGGLSARLRPLLNHDEIRALGDRIRKLIDAGCFPLPPTDRRVYPWPPV